MDSMQPNQAAAGRDWPSVYAVVPVYNRREKTMRFLEAFAAIDYPNKHVAITDDGSSDGTGEAIAAKYPDVPVLTADKPDLWWSGGTNLAVRYAMEHGADYILTINDDVEIDPGFLKQMVIIARQDPKRIVGCRIHRQDAPELIWSLGASCIFRRGELYRLNFAGNTWEQIAPTVRDPHPVDTMPGNGVLLPASVFREVGMYDERCLPQYHADSDLVLRARRAGYKPVISLQSVLYNHIPTEPLVNCRKDLVFSKKSDYYWRAMWTTLSRHGCHRLPVWQFALQYARFFLPPRLKRAIKRMFPGTRALD